MASQTLKQLEKEKEEIEKKIQELKNNSDEYEWISIPNIDFEVTKKVLHKGKSYNEIMKLKPKDCELLDLELIGKIMKNPKLVKTLKMDGRYSTSDDFFFEQPCLTNKEKNYIAQFYSGSDRSYFYCNVDSGYSDGGTGVRWCRRKKNK